MQSLLKERLWHKKDRSFLPSSNQSNMIAGLCKRSAYPYHPLIIREVICYSKNKSCHGCYARGEELYIFSMISIVLRVSSELIKICAGSSKVFINCSYILS